MMAKKSVQVVIPVYNEEKDIENCVIKLREFLSEYMDKYDWGIAIANNASTDKTLEIAKRLSKKYNDVSYIHLEQKGRGRALRKAWTETKADIVSYMDVDLSTDLEAFPVLIEAEKKGYRIFETPVTWDEDLHSKVRIFKTVYDYLRDVSRLRWEMFFN